VHTNTAAAARRLPPVLAPTRPAPPPLRRLRPRVLADPQVTLKDGLQRMVADFKARLHVS
jgi:hypothetical protein